MDDDAKSIITAERYKYIESIIKACVTKKNKSSKLTVSDKIDRIVTNRCLALPIFAIGCEDWLKGLILDGIVGGVGAVLGFVPQMLVLFFLLAFLESCGSMARIAFIMDRIFRRFGLSGKSFIPMLVGTGCGVPGIMASRTIENDRDRKMTIITTTFIPCGAKTPFIAMIAGAIFGGSPWIATSSYFIGIAAILCSGIMLKKTKMFSGDVAPFVMELPAYHWPTIVIWFLSFFCWVDGTFGLLEEDQMDFSILAYFGRGICWIFQPLGWGNWHCWNYRSCIRFYCFS